MNNNQPQGNQRPKTLFNDYRGLHPATRNIATGAKFAGQLTWELCAGGKIKLKADDKVRTEGNAYTKKEIEMDFHNRNSFFELLLRAANDPMFTKGQFAVKKHQWIRGSNGNQLSDQPLSQGEFTVIRDENGVISVGYSKSDYKILFDFSKPGFSTYREFVNGEWVDAQGKLSQDFVRGWVNGTRHLLDRWEWDNYTPPKPKNGGNGNWNGGGNNNGGGGNWNGGGNNNSGGNSGGGSNDFDDEIPF